MGGLHAKGPNVPKKAAEGSSEQNPKDAAVQSDRPEALRCEDPAVKETSAGEGAPKRRPRRKAVAKEREDPKEAMGGKEEDPGEKAPSAREGWKLRRL